MRLDIFVSEHFSLTRNRAKSLIESGLVFVDEKEIRKPAFDITEMMQVTIQEDRRIHWVSRSAEKLYGFLEHMEKIGKPIEIHGKICLDVGSSTGGFSQVLLEKWAESIDAVDVGTDQLHPSLRSEVRIQSYEQMDIRDFVIQKSDMPYDIVVCDASFISLKELLSPILYVADSNTQIILLYKPQFEVGRANLRKTWVPKDEKIIDKYIKNWEIFLKDNNCEILQKERSYLIWEAGNQEWVYLVRKGG